MSVYIYIYMYIHMINHTVSSSLVLHGKGLQQRRVFLQTAVLQGI